MSEKQPAAESAKATRPAAESASGIKKARACLRQWAWGYIDGVWPPEKKEAAEGALLHAVNERFLTTGVAPTLPQGATDLQARVVRLFELGRTHLPLPKTPGLCIEQKKYPVLFGRRHVVVPDLEWLGQFGVIHLYDYKSTKWAKTAKYRVAKREQYLDDPQFALYATYLFHKYPDAKGLEGKWIYYLTPDERFGPDIEYEPKVYAAPVMFQRDEIYAAYHRIVAPVTDQLVTIRTKGLRAMQVQGTLDECGEKGGCHYATLGCDPMSIEGDVEMSDLDALFGEFTKPAAPAAEAPKAKPDVINAPEKSAVAAEAKAATPVPVVEIPSPTRLENAEYIARNRVHALYEACYQLNAAGLESNLRALLKSAL